MIVVYDRSFIVLACVITIVNYDPKSFIVQATAVSATLELFCYKLAAEASLLNN